LGKTAILSKRMTRYMASDHIGASTGIVKKPDFMPGPGYGFGLGFAVRLEAGAAISPGSPGEFHWTGVAGTCFWIDPVEDLFVILMTQAPAQRQRLRAMVKTMVYDSLTGGRSLRV
jgi:CubicO group peptidase (beta-lactamase class C family)